MRDKISHFYFGINYEIVWKVVKERLPEIKLAVEKILKELTEKS
ncbi:HepT-like ribonuclease domain-containing protein [Dissulfurispira sp.]